MFIIPFLRISSKILEFVEISIFPLIGLDTEFEISSLVPTLIFFLSSTTLFLEIPWLIFPFTSSIPLTTRLALSIITFFPSIIEGEPVT